jgi:hypothetical protein
MNALSGEKMSFFMTRSREMVPFGRYFLMIFLRKKQLFCFYSLVMFYENLSLSLSLSLSLRATQTT